MVVVSWANAREESGNVKSHSRLWCGRTRNWTDGNGFKLNAGSRVPSDILLNPLLTKQQCFFPHSTLDTQPNSPCVSLNAWHIRSALAQLTNLPYSRDASAGSYTKNPFWRHIKDIRIRTCSENWNSIIRHWSEMCARGPIHSRNRVSFHSHSYYVSRDSLTLKKTASRAGIDWENSLLSTHHMVAETERLRLLCVGADSRPGRSRSHAHTAELSRRRENHSPAILTECFLMKRSNSIKVIVKKVKKEISRLHTKNSQQMSNV